MKAIIKKPWKPPEIIEIENSLRALRKVVDGCIRVMPIPKTKLIMIVNDADKRNNLMVNLYIYRRGLLDCICGDIIIAASNGKGGLRDLTDEEIKKAREYCERHSDYLGILGGLGE